MIRSRTRITLIALVLAGLGQTQTRAQTPTATPMARVSLLSSVEAIAPGEPFELGVRFELENGWHIYWQNSGDSGMPPDISWTLPEGLTVGPARYPIPKRHHSPGDIVTNILPGAPMLLFTATPDSTIIDGIVTVGAKVTSFVCKEKCLREQSDVSVELSVLPAGAKPPEANAKEFRRARRTLPKTESKFLSVRPSLSPERPSPGSKFELTLAVDVKRGFHIQSNKPSQPTFIPADVFLKRVDGLRFDDPRLNIAWPLPIGELSPRDAAHPLLEDGFEGMVV
jgi:DsbC/DsbD-like thiol-disulfide interchange protein